MARNKGMEEEFAVSWTSVIVDCIPKEGNAVYKILGGQRSVAGGGTVSVYITLKVGSYHHHLLLGKKGMRMKKMMKIQFDDNRFNKH